jgi:hypothetical protein
LIDRLATFAGISYPPALLFLAAAMVLLIKGLHADILNTRVEREVRRLNQRLALLELEWRQADSLSGPAVGQDPVARHRGEQ